MLRIIACLLAGLAGRSTLGDSNPRCGAYCLFVALSTIERPVEDLAALERVLGPPTKAGYSLGQLEDAARRSGAHTLVVQSTLDRLNWRERPFAVIAHVDGSHFVNVTSFEPGQVTIVDAPRTANVSPSAFNSTWAGAALLLASRPLEPEESLQPPVEWKPWVGGLLGLAGLCGIARSLYRRRWRVRPVIVVAAVLAAGCTGAETLPRTGRVRVPDRYLDLGPVQLSSKGRRVRVTVENTGAAALRLVKIRSACSCLVVEEPPGELAPGESAELQVEIRPDSPGERRTSFVLFTDDTIQPQTKVEVRWEGVGAFDCQPPFVDLGELQPGAVGRETVTIACLDPDCDLGVPVSRPASEVTAELERDLAGWRLSVGLRGGMTTGEFHGYVRIPVSGCDAPAVEVPVHWRVREVVTAVPGRLPLGRSMPGARVERQLKLVSSKGDVQTRSVTAEGLELDLAAGKDEAGQTVLRVGWVAPDLPGIYSGTIFVDLDLPEMLTVRIPVSGSVGQP